MSKQRPQPDPAVEKAVRVLATRLFLGFYRRANPAILAALRDSPLPSVSLPRPPGIDVNVLMAALDKVYGTKPLYQLPPEQETEKDSSPFHEWCEDWRVPETPEVAEEVYVTQNAWISNSRLAEQPKRKLRWGFEIAPGDVNEVLARRPALRWEPFVMIAVGPNSAETVKETRERLTQEFKAKRDTALQAWRRERRISGNQGRFRREALRDAFSRPQTLDHLRWLARKQALRDPESPEHSTLSLSVIGKELDTTANGTKKALVRAAALIGLRYEAIRHAQTRSRPK